MNQLAFVIYAHGRKVHAKLVKLDCKSDIRNVTCPHCGSKDHLSFIAEATQYSFVSDMHWKVFNCDQCHINVAFQYEEEIPLAKMVERMK